CGPLLEQLADRRADQLGLEPHQPPEVEACDGGVPADEPRGVERRPGTAREPDCHDGSERPQLLDRCGEHLAADLVEDHVERLEATYLVVENRLCSTEAEHVGLLL